METSAVGAAFETIERISREYWAADQKRDHRRVGGLARALTKAEDAEQALPALSNADASAKVRFAAGEIALSDSDRATRETARLERLSVAIGAPDSPRQRFELHWHLRELASCASWLRFVDLERGTLERALPRLEAAIAWLERPRTEHCPEEGVTIYYIAPGLAMVTRLGQRLPLPLYRLLAA
jgi:hypothetical protein